MPRVFTVSYNQFIINNKNKKGNKELIKEIHNIYNHTIFFFFFTERLCRRS